MNFFTGANKALGLEPEVGAEKVYGSVLKCGSGLNVFPGPDLGENETSPSPILGTTAVTLVTEAVRTEQQSKSNSIHKNKSMKEIAVDNQEALLERSSAKQEGENSKRKKMDGLGIGRGMVSFHTLKQMARSNHSRSRQNKLRKSKESTKDEKSKGRRASSCNSGSQLAISNEFRSTDTTEKLVDFGNKIGIRWNQ
ncbi:hypothetical protein L6452_32889 [Arctium lappa]|uniref:Uncharacterized protein n=1 Tax=Arctium lappa TaxID=4217 RepID=A0ACB8Z6G8_ARCLA|nr:hypothetical protein L6452_32889 [Arctium lappa]